MSQAEAAFAVFLHDLQNDPRRKRALRREAFPVRPYTTERKAA